MGLISGGRDYFISISIHVSSLNFVVGSCKVFCPATVPQCRRDLVIVLPMKIWLVVWNIFCFSIQLGIIVPIDYIIFLYIFQRGFVAQPPIRNQGPNIRSIRSQRLRLLRPGEPRNLLRLERVLFSTWLGWLCRGGGRSDFERTLRKAGNGQ